MTSHTFSFEQVLALFVTLQPAKASNALAAVRLAQVRQSVAIAAGPVREAFDEAAQRAAVCDEKGAPQREAMEGVPLLYKATLTPCYVLDPAKLAALNAEGRALLAQSITLELPTLTAADLAAITGVADGEALLPLVDASSLSLIPR